MIGNLPKVTDLNFSTDYTAPGNLNINGNISIPNASNVTEGSSAGVNWGFEFGSCKINSPSTPTLNLHSTDSTSTYVTSIKCEGTDSTKGTLYYDASVHTFNLGAKISGNFIPYNGNFQNTNDHTEFFTTGNGIPNRIGLTENSKSTIIYKNASSAMNIDVTLNYIRSDFPWLLLTSTYANLPSGMSTGCQAYCTDKKHSRGTTAGVMVWWNGTNWVDDFGGTPV